MDDKAISALAALNARFYVSVGESFSATRNAAWQGWERCADIASSWCAQGEVRLLDLGCGNLRLERFLAERFPSTPFKVQAVDVTPALAAPELSRWRHNSVSIAFHALDAIESARTGTLAADLARLAPLPARWFDAVCAFGLFHHVPGFETRVRMLSALVGALAPRGCAFVSLWSFMDDDRLARKARAATHACRASGALDGIAFEPGDWILDWRREPGAWRYCHHFDAAEACALVEAAVADQERAHCRSCGLSPTASDDGADRICGEAGAERMSSTPRFVIDSFSDDGATGALNRYLVVRRVR